MNKNTHLIKAILPTKPFIEEIILPYGIKEVDVKFATYGRTNHCNLEVNIYCNQTELIHTETINTIDLNDMAYYKLQLNDYVREIQANYLIKINSYDASNDNCVGVVMNLAITDIDIFNLIKFKKNKYIPDIVMKTLPVYESNQNQSPVNFRKIEVDDQKIYFDAEYALNVTKTYLKRLPKGKESLPGKSVLELGPGINFGVALSIKALGAKSVTVSDRFLSPLQESYHPRLYSKLAELILEYDPQADASVFERYVHGRSHEIVHSTCLPLEQIDSDNHKYDITLSNAVFEHLFDPNNAIVSLYNITNKGGVGIHQVDFRDHRDFDSPLEFLLLDEISFVRMFDDCHGECGSRIRPNQMLSTFKQSGFKKVKFVANMIASEEYMTSFMQKLNAQTWNLYSRFKKEDLKNISGFFSISK